MLKNVKTIEQYLTTMVDDLRLEAPVSSGDLSDSIDFNIDQTEGPLNMGFEMAEHGIYLDKGVSGTKKKYNTPFSYGNKMPPPRSLDRWIIQNGIAPRDKNGRLLPRKSIAFAIAKSVQQKGIEPRKWIDPVLDRNLDGLAFVLAEAIWQDFEDEENNK